MSNYYPVHWDPATTKTKVFLDFAHNMVDRDANEQKDFEAVRALLEPCLNWQALYMGDNVVGFYIQKDRNITYLVYKVDTQRELVADYSEARPL